MKPRKRQRSCRTGDPEEFREAERVFLLQTIDRKWMDHIDDMDQLRQSVSSQASARRILLSSTATRAGRCSRT